MKPTGFVLFLWANEMKKRKKDRLLQLHKEWHILCLDNASSSTTSPFSLLSSYTHTHTDATHTLHMLKNTPTQIGSLHKTQRRECFAGLKGNH